MTIQCEICGKEVREGKSIVRRLNGETHHCCCLRCEVSWEKANLTGVCG